MFTKIRELAATPIFEDQDKTHAAGLLNNVLAISLTATIIIGIVSLITPRETNVILIAASILGLLQLGLLFLIRRGYVKVSGALFLSAAWLVTTLVSFTFDGVSGPGPISYVTVILIANLVLNGYAALGFLALTVAAELGMLYAENGGHLPTPTASTTPLVMGFSQIANLFILGIVLYVVIRRFNRELELVHRNEHDLIESNHELEAHTRALEFWAVQLKTATEVGRAATSVHNLNDLLPQVTHLISERFGFYHTGIFLLDESGEFAVLRASNSEPGQKMLARNHKLAAKQESIVGYATSTGQPRIALDVGADAIHFKNPLLPETRSELALPLQIGERIIGALNVQSRKEAAFNDDNVTVLQTMADQLAVAIENARLLQRTQRTVQELSSTAAEILAAMTQQAAGASEQSAAISQTTTTVDQVRTIAEQSVLRAQEVADTSQRTVEVSRSGQQAVQDTIASMAQIKTRVEGIAENILELSEQTQQIGEIIATVNEIAAQSNILALNASVEAARAGEHGRGFAVVAAEVRNLAEQSQQATAQVKAILSDIQKATNATVMATEEGTKGVEEGVLLAAQAQGAIEQLARTIDESAQAATQVVAGGQQQSSGVEQIALAMGNINQATVQSLASTRQTEKAAQDLHGLARNLNEIVEQYRL